MHYFCFTIAYGHAHTQWGNEKENRAIDVSIESADPTLQKMKLEYKRESQRRIVIGTVGQMHAIFSQLNISLC